MPIGNQVVEENSSNLLNLETARNVNQYAGCLLESCIGENVLQVENA
jgi:hypothetical protein